MERIRLQCYLDKVFRVTQIRGYACRYDRSNEIGVQILICSDFYTIMTV